MASPKLSSWLGALTALINLFFFILVIVAAEREHDDGYNNNNNNGIRNYLAASAASREHQHSVSRFYRDLVRESGRPTFSSDRVLGPIIGEVTSTRAKVLIELLSAPGELSRQVLTTVKLFKLAEHPHRNYQPIPVRRIEQVFEVGRPTGIEFSNLQPDTRYEVRVLLSRNGPVILSTGSFRTSARPQDATRSKLRIGFVSCNNLYHLLKNSDCEEEDGVPTPRVCVDRNATAAWRLLGDEIESNGIDLLVHMGDQVYIDEWSRIGKWAEAEQVWNNTQLSDAEKRAQILDMFQTEYRRTWTIPDVHRVLRSVPNVMTWDDHEIRDDWNQAGSEDLKDHGIAALAREVFWMYQRSLRLDNDYYSDAAAWSAPSAPGHEGFSIFLMDGAVVVRILDVRTSRTFAHWQSGSPNGAGSQHPFLGDAQWSELVDGTLGPHGSAQNASVLIITSTVAHIWSSPQLIDYFAANFDDDFRDHYLHANNRVDYADFLDAIRAWRDRAPGRQAVLVSGDQHIGAKLQFALGGEPWMQELLTSPIGTLPHDDATISALLPYVLVGSGVNGSMVPSNLAEYAGKSHSLIVDTSSVTTNRNYGIVTVDLSRGMDSPLVTTKLVSAPYTGASTTTTTTAP